MAKPREEILTQESSIQQPEVLPKEEPNVNVKDVDNVTRKVSTDSCESPLFVDVRFGPSLLLSFKPPSTTFLDFLIL